ncbi:hypothetical protein SALBM135S_09395 [Streptomyces alboniger]
MTEMVCPEMFTHSLKVLVGPSSATESTLANTWRTRPPLSSTDNQGRSVRQNHKTRTLAQPSARGRVHRRHHRSTIRWYRIVVLGST